MYYPFIRGKQFELVMLREMAPRIATWGFVPIIEPVKGNFPALKRALDKLVENNCRFILIANPSVGELKEDNSSLWREVFAGPLAGYPHCSAGFCLTAEDSLETAKQFFAEHGIPIAVIHYGFSDGKGLASVISQANPSITEHVFVSQHSSSLYRKHFKGTTRVIVEAAFIPRTNKYYPPSELFSELYLTYEEMGCNAFGDFLIVDSEYKDGGGPARAVAIHLTYADPAADNAIAIKHYVSDQVDTVEDPAGKFAEALRKLVEDVSKKNSPIFRSIAVEEYLQLYKAKHFPGLGHVKKLSMQHHIELMAHLLIEEA
ncbi:MAG: sce7725 family protein [Trichloromonadaceae bacterium]